jgi:hypothetical protein
MDEEIYLNLLSLIIPLIKTKYNNDTSKVDIYPPWTQAMTPHVNSLLFIDCVRTPSDLVILIKAVSVRGRSRVSGSPLKCLLQLSMQMKMLSIFIPLAQDYHKRLKHACTKILDLRD